MRTVQITQRWRYLGNVESVGVPHARRIPTGSILVAVVSCLLVLARVLIIAVTIVPHAVVLAMPQVSARDTQCSPGGDLSSTSALPLFVYLTLIISPQHDPNQMFTKVTYPEPTACPNLSPTLQNPNPSGLPRMTWTPPPQRSTA